jgi:hypothetical protein
MKKFILFLLAFFPAFSFAAAFDPDRACVPLEGVASALVEIGAITSAKDFQSSQIIYKEEPTVDNILAEKETKFFSRTYAYKMRFKGTHGDVVLVASGECGYTSAHKDVTPGLHYLLMISPVEYEMKFRSDLDPPTYKGDRAKIWRGFKLKEFQKELNTRY